MHYTLNSGPVVRKFRSTTSMMSNVDYDLLEILSETIHKLQDGNKMLDLQLYWQSFLTWGDHQGQMTTDGKILAEAVRQLGLELRLVLSQMKLYDSNNMLHYRFKNLVGHTVIIEPVPVR